METAGWFEICYYRNISVVVSIGFEIVKKLLESLNVHFESEETINLLKAIIINK